MSAIGLWPSLGRICLSSRFRKLLAELSAQAWQHPCGTIADERADYDPRKRYGSYFAADRIAA
jgi:hypothetical protein